MIKMMLLLVRKPGMRSKAFLDRPATRIVIVIVEESECAPEMFCSVKS